MAFEKRESGLITPTEDPPATPPMYSLLEIQDEGKRKEAAEALLQLWDAMELSRGGGGIRLPNKPSPEASAVHYQVYRFVGELLLGRDCPEKGMLS